MYTVQSGRPSQGVSGTAVTSTKARPYASSERAVFRSAVMHFGESYGPAESGASRRRSQRDRHASMPDAERPEVVFPCKGALMVGVPEHDVRISADSHSPPVRCP